MQEPFSAASRQCLHAVLRIALAVAVVGHQQQDTAVRPVSAFLGGYDVSVVLNIVMQRVTVEFKKFGDIEFGDCLNMKAQT